MDRPYQVGMF